MKRRSFVQTVALSSAGAPLILKDFKFGAVSKKLFDVQKSLEDRVLVLIRLNGGNDGLNTLIPLDQYDNLAIQRANILLPETSLLALGASDLALHPAMTGMRNMFQNDRLTVIQNVGYPEQNRSHFRSMDIWTTGMMDPFATSGWLGRHLDMNFPNFPTDYPNVANEDPFAIAMGYEVSGTCQGLMGNFSISMTDPFQTVDLFESDVINDGTYYGSNMEYLATIIAQANAYGSEVNTAANAGNSLSTLYPVGNNLADQLKNVAKMISGGLKTKIYVLDVGGFDTHDSQVNVTDTTVGKHADLMKQVSDAIAAFQNDLLLLGLEDRVAGMTFSEFGRQIASNASVGTDHGDAAPLFIFGKCISSSVLGTNPIIDNVVEDQAGLPMQYDFRDIYASVLKDWFGADPAEIQSMFEHTVTFYNILGSCNLSIDEQAYETEGISVFPNPCASQTTVKFKSENERVTIQIFDLSGKMIANFVDKIINKGEHLVPLDLSNVDSGTYVLSVIKSSGNFSKRIIKVKHI
jgi:uncharacterized protein (DUF1501 family)